MTRGLRLARLGIALLAVAIVVTSIVVVLARNRSKSAAPTPTASGSPLPSPTPRTAFTFPPPEIEGFTVVGVGGRSLSREPAALIQSTLSEFYDQAFLDPVTWANGVPEDAWSAFDASVRERAIADTVSLALGDTVPSLASVEVTEATLSVHVLLNTKKKPDAAFADVVFKATGTLSDGEEITITNRAEFLLRPVSNAWLIFGYPKATTRVAGSPVSATPTPSATPTGATP
jgi:hypothetical protein